MRNPRLASANLGGESHRYWGRPLDSALFVSLYYHLCAASSRLLCAFCIRKRLCVTERTRRAVLLSIPHAALCVSGRHTHLDQDGDLRVSMPHAALCVSGPLEYRISREPNRGFNAARGIMCVGTTDRTKPRCASCGFNAARGIMCVGTMCPAALVPRGLRRRFGKTKRRNVALRQRRSTFHFLLLYDSTRFVLFQ